MKPLFVRAVSFFILIFLCQSCAYRVESKSPEVTESIYIDDLRQVSSITIFRDWLIILPQKSSGFYRVKLQEVDKALRSGESLSDLEFVEFKGQLPAESSWEAISFAQSSNKWVVYLSYEHSADEEAEDDHFFYRADVVLNPGESFSLAAIERVSEALPMNPSTHLSVDEKINLGYEAIAWSDSNNQLIALGEMDGHSALRFSFKRPQTFELPRHGLRISDMTREFGDQCYIVSSFCWRGDPKLCDKNNGESRVSLNLLQSKNGVFEFVAQKDISSTDLIAPALDSDKSGEFNLEGLALDKKQLYMVNDDYPGTAVGTLLKRVELPKAWQKLCKI